MISNGLCEMLILLQLEVIAKHAISGLVDDTSWGIYHALSISHIRHRIQAIYTACVLAVMQVTYVISRSLYKLF